MPLPHEPAAPVRRPRLPHDRSAAAAPRTAPQVDGISTTGGAPGAPYIDQEAAEDAPAAAAAAPAAEDAPAGGGAAPAAGAAAAAAAAAPAAAAALARPTNLIQILTGWSPGPARYGFQLKFRCRSTSGNVADLQAQAPNLLWRERVTYGRNDFAHRFVPNNPTILPAGGVSFAPGQTRRVGQNLLEFTGVTDTHWFRTSWVRPTDFAPTTARPLPATIVSDQTYQYSADGGGSWRYFAGSFSVRRTLARSGAGHTFTTRKSGVHSVTEPYKP